MTKHPASLITSDDNFARSVVENCADGLLVIDAQGVVQFANPAAISLFADCTANLVGFHVGIPAIHEPVETILPGRDGFRHVEMRSTEIIWGGRSMNLACLRDMTVHKRAEEVVRKHAKELSERNQ